MWVMVFGVPTKEKRNKTKHGETNRNETKHRKTKQTDTK